MPKTHMIAEGKKPQFLVVEYGDIQLNIEDLSKIKKTVIPDDEPDSRLIEEFHKALQYGGFHMLKIVDIHTGAIPNTVTRLEAEVAALKDRDTRRSEYKSISLDKEGYITITFWNKRVKISDIRYKLRKSEIQSMLRAVELAREQGGF